ncbi:hypothetical protein KBC03_01380 [Patescibacteria group bacterium]|nr:hypothetical protein [Patescibacteria group bacterium]
MKIFSNFDTRAPLEAYQKALAEYGADQIMFFRRYRIYLIFFVVLPALATILGIIGSILLWQMLFANSSVSAGSTFGVVLIIFITLIVIMVGITILFSYINYLLDYTIVTPHLITSWNQK